MVRSFSSLLALVFLFSLLSLACGGCGSDAKDTTVSLRITSTAMQDGGLACPKDQSVSLAVEASDSDGKPVSLDAAKVTWTVDAQGPTFALQSSGPQATLTAQQDWFDTNGAEPSATVSVHYGDASASAPAKAVINATGVWLAKLDLGFTQTLTLSQNGRTVTDDATHISGTVDGDTLAIAASGFKIKATFSSRTEAAGTYEGSGLTGTLTCTKQ